MKTTSAGPDLLVVWRGACDQDSGQAGGGLSILLLETLIVPHSTHFRDTVAGAGRVARAGRQGRALSLLTREELLYLLDLHLFLSRPLEPSTL